MFGVDRTYCGHHESDANDPKLTPLRREYAASTEERPACSETPPCAGPLRPCSGIRLWAIRCDCRFSRPELGAFDRNACHLETAQECGKG
jgi:hypothetical protein